VPSSRDEANTVFHQTSIHLHELAAMIAGPIMRTMLLTPSSFHPKSAEAVADLSQRRSCTRQLERAADDGAERQPEDARGHKARIEPVTERHTAEESSRC
jgi:hypothetical protein